MANRLTAASLLAFVFFLPCSSAVGSAAGRSVEEDASEFADRLLEIADDLSSRYFTEISQDELIERSVRGLYRRLSPGITAELDERLRRVGAAKDRELRSLLIAAWKDVSTRPGMSGDRILDLALEEMTRRLDGLTWVVYGTHQVNGEARPPLVGVGLKLASDPSSGMIRVVTPLLNGPAYKAGIRANDLITRITLLEDIEGQPLKEPVVIPTKGLSLTAALKCLAGEPGTRVGLTYQQAGAEKPTDCTLVREDVEETVFGLKRKGDNSWDYWIDPDKKIAYVRLGQFGEQTAEDLERVLNSLQKEGFKGLVLDLRFNPGGLLSPAVKVSDLMIDNGEIVTVRSRGKIVNTIEASRKANPPNFPIVCLVNGETAQASEVVAACLQDHRRAVVMGERTKGDGACQTIVALTKSDCYLLLTMSILYRPNGKKLHKAPVTGTDEDEWGVSPDPAYVLRLSPGEQRELNEHLERQTVIPSGDRSGAKEDGREYKDRQLEMALAYLRTQVKKP